MSVERELLVEALEWMEELNYVWLNSRISGDSIALELRADINKIELLLTQPEREQEVYAKGYAEAMRQQVYEAFEAGRKSALSNDWDKERDVMSEAWYLPDSNQEPVAVVGSVFSLLWINRGHHSVSVGDFLYTSPPTREPLSDKEIQDALIRCRQSTTWDYGFEAGVSMLRKCTA